MREHTQGSWLDRALRRILGAADIVAPLRNKLELNVLPVLSLYAVSVKKFWPLGVLIVLLTTAGNILAVIIPTYYKDFFNVLAEGLSAGGAGEILLRAIAVILIFDVLAVVARRVGLLFLVVFTKQIMIDLRIRAFNHVIEHSEHYYQSVFVGSLVQKLNRFARSYDRLADSVIFHILPTIVTLLGVVIVLMKESPTLAGAMIAWVIAVILLNYWFSKWMLRYNIYRAELDSQVTGKTADMFTNHAAIEAHATHDIEKESHAALTRHQMHVTAFMWNAGSLFHGVQELSIVFIKYGIFALGIAFWLRGEFPLGMFMLIHAYVFQITDRVWSFGQVVRDIYESFADAKEMSEAMNRPHEITDSASASKLTDVRGEIMLKGVTFQHAGKYVVNNVSVTIRPGERVALVGPSGAGKSTLVKLLTRVFDPREGSVHIDGRDIREVTRTSLKRAISNVPQDPVLFHRTLMENIRYGKLGATDSDVLSAAALAHCHDFIMEHPANYEALVGERGVKLSGGERQRVAIARAFLKNAPILILDEATSSLDSGSEQLVQDALMRLMEGRTTIVIAHRLSTIRRMDRILVLDQGRIVEDGTHKELLAQKGAYWKLWTLQQGGFTSEDADVAAAGNATTQKLPT